MIELRLFRILLTLLFGCVLATSRSGQATEDQFEASFAQLRGKIEGRQWKGANKLLEQMFVEHANKDYLLQHRTEIIEDLKRCLFWSEHKEPKPNALVSGNIKRYSASTGQIKIVYTPETMEDFVKDKTKTGSEIYYHPASFSGKHSIQVEGRSYDYRTVLLAALDWPTSAFGVQFGRPPRNRYIYPARILQFENWGRPHTVAQNEDPPSKQGAKYKIRLTIDKKKIKASWGGKTIVEGEKDERQWGSLGFIEPGDFDRITLEGRCERSWIQGRIDQSMRKAWDAFEESFDPESHLPEWLRAGVETSDLDVFRALPVEESDEAWGILDKALELFEEGDASEGLKYASGLGTGTLKPLRLYVNLLFHVELGNVAIARKLYDDFSESTPDFAPARLLRARTLVQGGDLEEALAAYRKLLELDPELPIAQAELAWLLLVDGRADEARSVVGKAQRMGLSGEELGRIGRALVKLERGPEWAQAFEWKSKHYHVRSDIDKRICRDAADVLEAAFNLYSRALGDIDLERRFDVFLFSGEASYLSYASDLYDFDARGTNGFYTNTIKQLLIWNLPQREDMLRTVRHEGLHQFMDSAYGPIPRWLNEGLAEYFENAERNGTRWELGLPHAVHKAVLAKLAPIDMKDFLVQSGRQFMAQASLSYAQSWAIVHLLKHGDLAEERLLERYFEALERGRDPMKAFQAILEDVGWSQLDRALRRHLRKL